MNTKRKYLEHIGECLRVNFSCLAVILVLSSCMCLCVCACMQASMRIFILLAFFLFPFGYWGRGHNAYRKNNI
jgi:hypothetical protein